MVSATGSNSALGVKISLLSGNVVKSLVDGGALVGLASDVNGLRSVYHNTQRVAAAVSLIMARRVELLVGVRSCCLLDVRSLTVCCLGRVSD